MPSNFNNVAYFYDRLSQIVYGKALVNAEKHFSGYLKPASKILIVGGGSGKIIETISDLYNEGISITYVEISAKMMEISKKRKVKNNTIVYINKAIEEVVFECDFDVIVTSFFFVNFTQSNVDKLLEHLNAFLKPDGLWINTDFQLTGKWWQYFLLKSMYFFFKITCHIETTRLQSTSESFQSNHYTVIAKKAFYGKFILSQVLQKKGKQNGLK